MPPDRPPADTATVKYLKFQSKLLSQFHGRPMYLRAGVILPRDFAREPDRKYPLLVVIGGYGAAVYGGRHVVAAADPRGRRARWSCCTSTAPGRSAIRTRSTPPTTAPMATPSPRS